MENKNIRILIVEDEPLIARNLQQILTVKNYIVSGMAYDQAKAVDKLAQKETDLVLLDINLNGQFSGLDIAAIIFKKYQLPFIFITSYADEKTLEKAKIFQPSGYIVKPFEEREIYAAIEVAWYNFQRKSQEYISLRELNEKITSHLTPKEFNILLDLAKGKPYQKIANDHFVSINTVNSHVKSIYTKLGIHSRTEAANMLR